MTDQEKVLHYKTSIILKKDTSQMKLNDIIEELIHVIEQTRGTKIEECHNQKIKID